MDGARVETLSLRLKVWRGGQAGPEGRVPLRGSLVEGEATYELSEAAQAGEELVLLDFTRAKQNEPRDLDELALATYVEGPFDRAEFTLLGARADERDVDLVHRREGARGDLVFELPEGTTRVSLRYRVYVPHGYWPFGCIRRRCSLSGAAAPLPSVAARGGVYLPEGGRVVRPVHWNIESVEFAEPDPRERFELVVASTTADPRRPYAYPSIFWGPRWKHMQLYRRGVKIELLHLTPRPQRHEPNESVLQMRRDVPGHVMRIASEAVDLATATGIEPPPDAAITVVQGPLRSQVAQFHPAAVTVSDHFLELFPNERLSKFHDVAVARAVMDTLSYGFFAGRHDPSTDHWVSGALGMALTGIWQRFREHRDEYAQDILAGLTFVPAVDRFLYTGQAAFSSSYFRGSEDIFPVRDHPLVFSHELPTGRRLHEKMVDLLGEAQVSEFYAALVKNPHRTPVLVAEDIWGRELDWFFGQWLGPYPALDYMVRSVDSRPAAGGGFDHVIGVQRNGDEPVIEPLQVVVVERGGKRHYLVWNGEDEKVAPTFDDVPKSARHTFELHTQRRIRYVRLDPRSRHVQTSRDRHNRADSGTEHDPRFNDRRPPKLRFLYTGVGLSVAASEFAAATTPAARFSALSGFVFFEGSLQRDIRRSTILHVFKDRETDYGFGTAMNFYFGKRRNRQRRRIRLRPGLTVAQLNDRGLDPRGGIRITENLALSYDTRKFAWWPERGFRVVGGARASQAIRTDRSGDDRYYLAFFAAWSHLWRIAHDHVVATNIAADFGMPLGGTDPEFRSLSRVGGIGGLQGFSADEVFGLGTLHLQAEYRHVFINDLRVNLANLIWIRSIGGVLFGGTASTSACDSYAEWFGERSWYGQVGYGLTAYMHWLGVTPQLLRVEAAVPLGRQTGRTCLGERFPDVLAERQDLDPADVQRLLPPVSVNVVFNQPF